MDICTPQKKIMDPSVTPLKKIMDPSVTPVKAVKSKPKTPKGRTETTPKKAIPGKTVPKKSKVAATTKKTANQLAAEAAYGYIPVEHGHLVFVKDGRCCYCGKLVRTCACYFSDKGMFR